MAWEAGIWGRQGLIIVSEVNSRSLKLPADRTRWDQKFKRRIPVEEES